MAKRSTDPIPSRARAAVTISGLCIDKRKFDIWHAYPHRSQNREILFNDMAGCEVALCFRVEQARCSFAQQRRRESEDSRCAGRPSKHRRLQQPLQIDGNIVTASSEMPHCLDNGRTPGCPHRHTRIDRGDQLQQVVVSHIDKPVDLRLRVRSTNRRRCWDRMNDVSQRAETDDENIQEFLIRASRSRVE